MIPASDYLDFLRTEYFAEFVREGGAAVKFVISSDDEADSFHQGLRARAESEGYLYALVDGATTRLQMSDQVFFAVARQFDWDDLARRFLRAALPSVGLTVPSGLTEFSMAGLAAAQGLDAVELTRDVKRMLITRLYRDTKMVQEMRIATMRLCQHVLGTGDTSPTEHQAIVEWLTGDLKKVADLRSALIFRRIARNNARGMLFSLAEWARHAGYAGLVLDLDIRRLAVIRRPPVSQQTGTQYYTKSASLDVYENLRQLVDSTDEMTHLCAVVTAAPEFLADDNRGVMTYDALRLRILDEVRDKQRDNPFSSLVRLVEVA